METSLTLAELTTKNYHNALVFNKYGLDFCCNGKKTLNQACIEKNVDQERIIKELNEMNDNLIPGENYNEWNIDFLADYIVNSQHAYVKKYLPIIDQFLTKTVNKHALHHPELTKIKNLFKQAQSELLPHMEKEEHILFPYVKQLVLKKQSKTIMNTPSFGTVKNPIAMMQQEHEIVGEIFKNIHDLSGNFIAPVDACNTYKVTYSALHEFEENLHLHIHLENNILFPKAIILEEELFPGVD